MEGTIDEGNDVGSEWKYLKEVAEIQQCLSLFAEFLESSPKETKKEAETKNELLRVFFQGSFRVNQKKLIALIDLYQDEDRILPELLDLHDWMESTLAHYTLRLQQSCNTNNDVQTITTTTTTTITTTTTTMIQPMHMKKEDELFAKDNNQGSKEKREKHREIEEEESDSDFDDITFRTQGDKRKEDRENTVETDKLFQPRRPDINMEDEDEGEEEEELHVSEPPKPFKVGYKIPEGPGSCPVCCEDDIPPSNLCMFDPCNHMYCKECLQGYYQSKIKEGKVLNITCPFPKCTTQVEYHHVQDVVTAEEFAKYEEFAFMAALNADPSIRWCPKPGCGNAIIGDPLNPHCECTNSACKFEFCFLCNEPWHPDASCEQYQQWKLENGLTDTKFDQWAKKNTKKCPKCKNAIEKMAGCNHMTCWNCKYEFCWLCGGKYSGNHFDVFNVFGCPGMQSGSKQPGVARRIGMRALIGTGIVLGGIIGAALAVPTVVLAGPIYGGYKLHQRQKALKRRSGRRKSHAMEME